MTDDAAVPTGRPTGNLNGGEAAASQGPVGPARDFAAFCELERERRRNSDADFDPARFDAALALVLAKLGGPGA
jgi:hypothetical protein